MPKPPPPPDTTSYLQDIPIARLLRAKAMYQVGRVIEEVRSGRPVDLTPVQETVSEIVASAQRNPEALCSLVRLRSLDEYTFTHSINTCVLAVMIARQGLPGDLESVGLGALLHDVGKSAIPTEILQKSGPLTEEEKFLVQQHPHVGLELLSRRRGLDAVVADAVAQHHERRDGTGYPEGLNGAEIGPGGSIVAVADAYDAMTSERPYRRAWRPTEVIRWISHESGRGFDPDMVLALVRALGVYPVGSVVRLNSGELAIVCAANPQAIRQPRVLVISSPLGAPLTHPSRLDLARPGFLGARREIAEVLEASDVTEEPEKYLETEEEVPEYQPTSLDSQA